ncbi:MAG: RteC domain-containing protein [Rikenellaceae bacterium]
MYADVELQDVASRCPDNKFIVKASRMVQKLLDCIHSELKERLYITNDNHQRITKPKHSYKWTTDDVHFVELVYGLIESKSIENENGSTRINEFAYLLEKFLGIELRNSHDTYSSTIKRRNKDDRAYFLNRLVYILNKKMNHEDGMQSPALPVGHTRTLFDEV